MNARNKEKLHKIIKEVLAVDAADDLSMNAVSGWDSLRHIQLLAHIEQAFEIEIDFRDTMAMTNMTSIKKILQKYVGEK